MGTIQIVAYKENLLCNRKLRIQFYVSYVPMCFNRSNIEIMCQYANGAKQSYWRIIPLFLQA